MFLPVKLIWNTDIVQSICDSAVITIPGRREKMDYRDSVILGIQGQYFSHVTIIIYGQNSALPIELIYAHKIATQNGLLFQWATLSERNNWGFELLQDSVCIGFVPGHGTTLEPQFYSFQWVHPIKNYSFLYRLKQIDLYGASIYYTFE